MRQAAALVRALAATAGESAVRRGLPTYAGLAIASGMLFGGNGLEAVTVVVGARDSALACLLLWSGWLLVTLPTQDAIWRTPTSFWLRSLPVPRAAHLAVLLGFSLLAEAPWAFLWYRGGGLFAGLTTLGTALALHAVLLARPAGLRGLVVLPLLAAPLLPIWLLSLGSWPIALVAFRRAWLDAPARGGHHPRSVVGGPAPLALALAHLAGLVRAHLPLLLRAALLAALAATAAWLAARNNALTDLTDLRTHALGFFAPAALLAGSALSGPLLLGESRARWLLAVTGTTPRTRLAAHALAAALPGALLATGVAALLAGPWRLAPLALLRLLADLVLAGLALPVLSALIVRWTARFGDRAAGRNILAQLLTAILVIILLARLGPAAALAWTALALITWLSGHVLSATPPSGHVLPTPPPSGHVLPTPSPPPILTTPPTTAAPAPTAHPAGDHPVLTMTGIRKRLGARLVLDAVDLTCPPGGLALVLGANGAGKSTLLRVAAGIVEPDAGAVHIAGRPLTAAAARLALGYAPDTADAFPDLSVRELLALVAALKRAAPPPADLRDRLGLAPVWHQRLRTLSFGQVKRTWLLAALTGEPALLVLDEPSNGLDPAGADDLADLLRERATAGHAALVATNDAAFADRLGGARHRLESARLTPA